MAFDEAMLGDVVRRPETVHLRLYTWRPAAITLGVHQDVARAVRLDRLGDTPLLRRVTGGRAVYHDSGELTYSIALNLDNRLLSGWGTSVQDVYLRLAEGLKLFLLGMGVSAQIVRRSADERPIKADQISAPNLSSNFLVPIPLTVLASPLLFPPVASSTLTLPRTLPAQRFRPPKRNIPQTALQRRYLLAKSRSEWAGAVALK
jgi:hypothetical protein